MKNKSYPKPISEIPNIKHPRILTYGTYDLLHEGHKNLFENILNLTEEINMFIGVSSDEWNSKKGKNAFESQDTRVGNIKNKYKDSTVFLEDHNLPEETWPTDFDKYNIDYILMGEDHVKNLSYINDLTTPQGRKMKIIFFNRTEGISSTMIREAMKDNS